MSLALAFPPVRPRATAVGSLPSTGGGVDSSISPVTTPADHSGGVLLTFGRLKQLGLFGSFTFITFCPFKDRRRVHDRKLRLRAMEQF
jgi:hypothetical protein